MSRARSGAAAESWQPSDITASTFPPQTAILVRKNVSKMHRKHTKSRLNGLRLRYFALFVTRLPEHISTCCEVLFAIAECAFNHTHGDTRSTRLPHLPKQGR